MSAPWKSMAATTASSNVIHSFGLISLRGRWRASLLEDHIIAEDQFLRGAIHFFRSSRRDSFLHIFRRAQSRVTGHEGHSTGIRSNINRREVGVGRDYSHACQRASQHFRSDLRGHRVRSLADFGRTCIDDNSAIAVDLDVNRGVRHVGADDRIRRPAHIMAASDPKTASLGQLAVALLPTRALNRLLDALRQSVTLHTQAVHRDARRLQQIALPYLRWIHRNLRSEFIQLRFEGEAHVNGAVAAHGSARRLVGQHAVTVVLNVRNVIERAEQRSGIKNRDHAVRAVGAAILHYASYCFTLPATGHGGRYQPFVLVLFPALAMALAVLSFNFLGDALRDYLDPHTRIQMGM